MTRKILNPMTTKLGRNKCKPDCMSNIKTIQYICCPLLLVLLLHLNLCKLVNLPWTPTKSHKIVDIYYVSTPQDDYQGHSKIKIQRTQTDEHVDKCIQSITIKDTMQVCNSLEGFDLHIHNLPCLENNPLSTSGRTCKNQTF